MSHQYSKPPIFEAVLEFRPLSEISLTAIDKIRGSLRSQFPVVLDLQHFDVAVDLDDGVARVDPSTVGVKLTSQDGVDIRMVKPGAFTCSRMAPYCGWGEFSAAARRDFEVWKRHSPKERQLGRVGLRYINRIDIPGSEAEPIDTDDFFNFGIRISQPPFATMANFVAHVEVPLGADAECSAKINLVPVQPPVIGVSSYALDIDVSRQGPPIEDEKLWPLVERMREHKNFVFESCITDRARELFGDVR